MVSNEQRRRQLAREKYLRQQQRRESARHKTRQRNVVIAAVLAVVLAGGGAIAATGALSGSDKDKTKDDAAASGTPSAAPTSKAPDPCAKEAKAVADKKPKKLSWKKEPALTVDKSASYTMKLETTCGDISVAMDAGKAPHTVNSFGFLAGKGYFDHTKCHRLVNSGIFVLQCGDPQGTGAGGPGYTLPDENLKDPSIKGGKYPAGTVAMANQYNPQTKQGKNTGGSQFFLVYKESQLPPYYTPFGTVDKAGMKVLKKIADAGAGAPDQTMNTAPNASVVINKATVGKS
ncbi:peptidylprolyl isomerase [Streptomyces antimycoticus]|uniref:Peptidylprolyl isomerase n=3 Tax=Streptomyces TaxID=1883 RepID=A0ABD5JGT7_9ACTN|nr:MULTISPECIES: peptidylprolyl isomerase [Streptomyces]MEE4587618.1 peptidylprolyl isomerase [Streptomyces sp. DSM 41602]AJZ83468.1 peptidylprolyl isomerase [Streptomyces sp. AgN23]KUL48484.1 peptidylprolyl isomerase [Streptomyces violaceusniger]RSS40590.1 peptidylprolyl isomerase [Streptomyces sp. WAC05858]WJD96069.1 peptidylprolyl isomerase [Streptomyces antimycoticus]